MRRLEPKRFCALITLLGVCCLTGAAQGQEEKDRLAPAVPSWEWEERDPGPPSSPSDSSADGRAVFVPFWTRGLAAGSTRRPTTGPALADAFWADVAVGSREVVPARVGSQGSVVLSSFRRSAVPQRPGGAQALVAVVRIPPGRPGAAPYLEVVEPQTAIQSSARGLFRRRTREWAEYEFVVREPIPPMPPPVSRGLGAKLNRESVERHFDLRLTFDPNARRQGSR